MDGCCGRLQALRTLRSAALRCAAAALTPPPCPLCCSVLCVTVFSCLPVDCIGAGAGRPGVVPLDHAIVLPRSRWRFARLRHHKARDVQPPHAMVTRARMEGSGSRRGDTDRKIDCEREKKGRRRSFPFVFAVASLCLLCLRLEEARQNANQSMVIMLIGNKVHRRGGEEGPQRQSAAPPPPPPSAFGVCADPALPPGSCSRSSPVCRTVFVCVFVCC